MNTNDQWFEPGDKVMRVTDAAKLGLPYSQLHPSCTDYGVVCCIASCAFHSIFGNIIEIVGAPHYGYARCFRKVEEIKLCVLAAEKMKEPVEA